MILDESKMTAEHVPNTPRTHDADGRRVDEPTQCAKCLQSWPCEARLLLTLVGDLRRAS